MDSLKDSILELHQLWLTTKTQMSPDLSPLAEAVLIEAVPLIHQFLQEIQPGLTSFALKKWQKTLLETMTELTMERGVNLSSISLNELKELVMSRISSIPTSLHVEDLKKLSDWLNKQPSTPRKKVSDSVVLYLPILIYCYFDYLRNHRHHLPP